jgi:hypothetical protein
LATAAVLLILSAVAGCAPGRQLVSRSADPAEVTGTYTLLLYGCHYSAQLDNVAILVKEESRYPLEIFDIDSSYRMKKGLTAQQALAEADAFIRCSSYGVWRVELRQIPDESGGTIGYEMRPLYSPLEFGFPDVLLISYALKDGRVSAHIRLDPAVLRERDFFDSPADPGNN